MTQAIYLCGFMGCGKTTAGGVLADKLGLSCTDMDMYIENSQKMSIPQIFSEKGEEYFRSCETKAVKELGSTGGIIACGGGAMLREANAAEAAKWGRVVYIDTPFEVCWERISGDTNRPIVMANTKQSLCELYNTRKALYSANSHLTVSGGGSPEDIADRIISALDAAINIKDISR